MLPEPTVPPSLMSLLEKVGTFTAPSLRTFAALVTGLVATTGNRTVTGMLTAAGLSRIWSHDRAHAFFSRASWNAEVLGLSLTHLLVRALLPDGAALTVAVDDTLFKRSGKKVFAAAWQHDGAAKGPIPVGRGTCFVVVAIVVELPLCLRPVALPVMARLWRPKTGPSKVELAASMIRLLAVCHHQRALHVVADAAYHGKALRQLRGNVTFTTRLPANAVLYDLGPPSTGKRGRPALKGARLGDPAAVAATAKFWKAQVNRYGRTNTVYLAEVSCLWYGSFHPQTVRVILLRDDGTDTGYDLALVTTDLPSIPATLTADTPGAGPSRSPSPRPATCSASARPATAPRTPCATPSRSACTATQSPSSGTPCTAIILPTSPTSANASPGTPPRPSLRSPTCSPSSAEPSSPPDSSPSLLLSPPPTKSAPSKQAWAPASIWRPDPARTSKVES